MAGIGKLACSPRKGASIFSPLDRLAGIHLLIRLQTHLPGSNAPVGLYQDTACTTPATTAGQSVAAWRDDIGTTGITIIQGTAANRPTLQFVNGTPVVRFDGSNDVLSSATPAVSQPFTDVTQMRFTGTDGNFYIPIDSATTTFTYVARTDANKLQLYSGANFESAEDLPLNSQLTISGKFSGISSQSWVNGVSQAIGSAGTDGMNGLYLGAAHNNSSYFVGDCTCLFIGESITDEQRQTLESYATSLAPS